MVLSILLACSTPYEPPVRPVEPDPDPPSEPVPAPEPELPMPAVEAVDVSRLPLNEATTGNRALVAERLRYQVPSEATREADHPVWSWTRSGVMVDEVAVEVRITEEPWPDGDAESYAKHLQTRHASDDITVDTGRVFVAGEVSELPRLEVVHGDESGTLYIAGVLDDVAYTWTCRVDREATFQLALACMMPGTKFHLDPPSVPDRERIPTDEAQPLWSVPRAHWPCGASTSTGVTIRYAYGELDRCTISPWANVASCPTQITFASDEGTESSTFEYDGPHLVTRTMTQDGVTDTHRFEYQGDVLLTHTKERASDENDTAITAFHYESDGSLVGTKEHSFVRIARDEAGHITVLDNRVSRREFVWDGDRLKTLTVYVGGRKTGESTYLYACK